MTDSVENISIFVMPMARSILRCTVWSRYETRSSRTDREHNYCTSEGRIDQFRLEIPASRRDSLHQESATPTNLYGPQLRRDLRSNLSGNPISDRVRAANAPGPSWPREVSEPRHRRLPPGQPEEGGLMCQRPQAAPFLPRVRVIAGIESPPNHCVGRFLVLRYISDLCSNGGRLRATSPTF